MADEYWERTESLQGSCCCTDREPKWGEVVAVLDLRQSCDALEIAHQTSFFCLKPLSYTQRHLPQVCREIFRAREDCYSLLLRHTETCHPWDTAQLSLFQAFWLAAA